MNLLHLHGISRRYGTLTALNTVTLTVHPGDRLAITGPNGAGKSTLLGVIDGTIAATHGTVTLDGRDITRWPVHRRAAAGITRVFQHPMIADRHTVLGNVLVAVRRRQRLAHRSFPLRPAVARILAAWSLDILGQAGLHDRAHTPAGQLAYGHRRQLDLAIALANQPQVLLLDEPTAGLSAAETEHITSLLRQLPTTLTVVLVEHDPDVVNAIATRAVTLQDGRITEMSTAA